MVPVSPRKLNSYLRLARPHQYVKNGFVWLPLFFAYKLSDPVALAHTFYAFVVFCLAASSVYVLNDLKDIESDRCHPVKKHRPLAAGLLSAKAAKVFFAGLLGGAVVGAGILLPAGFWAILGLYLVLNLAYSLILKHMPLIDVVCIALGFVLRVFAGGLAAAVPISHWIVILTFLMALFLALAKRRDDLVLAANGHCVRKNLHGYNSEFVSVAMSIMASVILVAYLLYTVSPEVTEKHGTKQLYLTGFWVIIGILRYLQITFVEERSGSPSLVLLGDRFLQGVIACWLMNFYLFLYIL